MDKVGKYLMNIALLIPRDFLVGSALGFDPLPYPHYEAFIDDDEEALWDDMEAVASDLAMVLTRVSDDSRRSAS